MHDGDMDEEMEDFVGGYFEVSEVDFDYEFDASRFFDFTRPESSLEAEHAERWFESAPSYPPSPFVIKLKRREVISVENGYTSLKSSDGESMISSSNNMDCDMDPEEFVQDENKKGPQYHYQMAQDILKTKTKSAGQSSKPRSSTLMTPTASHLAKLNREKEVHSNRFLGRSQKPLTKIDERSSKNSLAADSNATKRQKLESGYLRKVAHLNHQSLLSHKLPKVRQVDASTLNTRLKVTVPREPALETAHRAQRHRFRNNSESGEHEKSKAPPFKARPLNSKILKAPSLPPQKKKSRRQSSFFQVFHLKTSERAMQHSSAHALNVQNSESTENERLNGEDARKHDKFGTIKRVKARPLNKKIVLSKSKVVTYQNVKEEATAELQLSNDNRLSDNPPIELFNKLSLKSNVEHNVRSQTKPPLRPKGPKENVPVSLKQEVRGYGRKQSQCNDEWRIPDNEPRMNINRSMDIR
ncbi:protein TPX2-like [Rhododendron vialii]|uniref:protein TPX2-like n=1 Tax=Rhododendron vialii TaxID=182163 RepID=UPI00265F58B3|nr:protein TPX2-like [Rhododendron vialii]